MFILNNGVVMKKFILFLACVAVIGCGLVYIVVGDPVVFKNNKLFNDTMIQTSTEAVKFNDVVPFEWDYVYVFTGKQKKSDIESVIGISHKYIADTKYDDCQQIIFIKNEKVVCCVSGRIYSMGYELSLADDGMEYKKGARAEEMEFEVVNVENVTHYNQMVIKVPVTDPNIR